jgi:glyoxylase-like metal-dependent hydrolase (beta-lactamase superfamily II)
MIEPIRIDAHNPSPMTGAGNATYLLLDDGGDAMLVDAGVGKAEHLAALDERLSREQARLTRVLVTHSHPDHMSGAVHLAGAYPGARFLKMPGPDDDTKVAWEQIAEGATVHIGGAAWTVLHTPGHAPDHLALWHEPSATIISGDLVVAGSSVAILYSKGGDLTAYLETLERLRRLRPARLLPAHGPRIDDPDALLRKCIEHRLLRERQVVAALADGFDTVSSIADSIYHGLAPALLPAARDTVHAHLEKLTREARVSRQAERWILTRAQESSSS